MNAASHPEPPRGLSNLIVHPQSDNGRSSARGTTDDLCAVLIPVKMPMPSVAAWVKEFYSPPRLWVTRDPSSGLELIAERATQAKILKFTGATQCLRENVIDMKCRQSQLLEGLAILASVSRSIRNELA